MEKDIYISCPYCGYKIHPDEVVFKLDTDDIEFDDERKRNISERIVHHANIMQFSTMTRGVLFNIPEGENNIDFEINEYGFHKWIRVKLSAAFVTSEDNKKTYILDGRNSYVKITKRLCPNCHLDIPDNYEKRPHHFVTMLGGRSAGKTSYLINLLQTIETQCNLHSLGAIEIVGASKNYYQPLIKYYDDNFGTAPPTPMDIIKNLLPVVLSFSSENGKSCYIIIHDVPGECMRSHNSDFLLNQRCFDVSQTVLWMVDTHQLETGGRFVVDDEGDYFNTKVNVHFNTFMNNNEDFFRKIKTLCIVLTKVDRLLMVDNQKFTQKSELVYDIVDVHNKGYDITIMKSLQKEIDNIFKFYNNDGGIIAKIKAKYLSWGIYSMPSLHLFGVSTYSKRLPDAVGRDIDLERRIGINETKHRICEPLFFLLAKWEMIPTINTGRISQEEEKTEEKPQKRSFFRMRRKKRQ